MRPLLLPLSTALAMTVYNYIHVSHRQSFSADTQPAETESFRANISTKSDQTEAMGCPDDSAGREMLVYTVKQKTIQYKKDIKNNIYT